MNQIDLKFRRNLEGLILQILEDYAANQPNLILKPLFDRQFRGNLENYPNFKVEWLQPYFAESFKSKDVPFAGINNSAEQLFFLNQLKKHLRTVTYNFRNTEYILPNSETAAEMATAAESTPKTFNYDQSSRRLILMGLVLPTIHDYEQRILQQLQTANSANLAASDAEDANTKNTYKDLEQNLIVQGLDGQFNQVITLAELQRLQELQKSLLANGHSQADINLFLAEEFAKKNIKFTEDGYLIPFNLSLPNQFTKDLADSGQQGIKLEGALSLLDQRLTLQVQQEFLLQSKGNLSLPSHLINFSKTSGEILPMEGPMVYSDSSGQPIIGDLKGNNQIFFIQDLDGNLAMVSFNKQDAKNDQSQADFQVWLPEKENPLQINETAQKVVLEVHELPIFSQVKLSDLVAFRNETKDDNAFQEPPKSRIPLPTSVKSQQFELPKDRRVMERPLGFKVPDSASSLQNTSKIPTPNTNQKQYQQANADAQRKRQIQEFERNRQAKSRQKINSYQQAPAAQAKSKKPKSFTQKVITRNIVGIGGFIGSLLTLTQF